MIITWGMYDTNVWGISRMVRGLTPPSDLDGPDGALGHIELQPRHHEEGRHALPAVGDHPVGAGVYQDGPSCGESVQSLGQCE